MTQNRSTMHDGFFIFLIIIIFFGVPEKVLMKTIASPILYAVTPCFIRPRLNLTHGHRSSQQLALGTQIIYSRHVIAIMPKMTKTKVKGLKNLFCLKVNI